MPRRRTRNYLARPKRRRIRRASGYFGYPRLMSRITAGMRKVFELRSHVQISSDGSGVINQYTSCSNPNKSINGVTVYQDWNNVKTLFDLYRVQKVKVHWMPKLPNDTSAISVYSPLYIFYDPDNAGATVLDIDTAIQFKGVKVKNLFRPFTFTVYPHRLGNTPIQGGWMDMGAEQDVGTINWITTGLTASKAYGTILFTMTVDCKSQR